MARPRKLRYTGRMTVREDSALLDLAARLAWQAADLILAFRARGCETETKPDLSPVTEADRQAEAMIVRGLRAATPDIVVVAEEEVSSGYVPPPSSLYWMVDPLDGTRDFVAQRDGFTVNIGLVRDRRPVLGVVAVPASAELFGGIVGHGAWRQGYAGRQKIEVRPPPEVGLAVLSSRLGSEDPGLLRHLGGAAVASITQLGSALKFCRIAEGAADAYVRLGRTMEWDTAGPEAVLTAAGGSLRTLDGGVLAYEKPDWANPPFICRGAPT
jgi:3'(2'), 5'-bisphosphate nucleotidase